MTKVVFLIRSLGTGGTERQLATLLPRLNKDRFDVTVMVFYAGGRFASELAANKVHVVCLDKRGRWDLVGFLWRLVTELRRLRPVILHSYLVEPNLIAVLIKPLFRSTRIVWGIRASNVDLKKYDWFARFNFRLQIFLSGVPDLIIFNSIAGRDHHFAGGSAQKRTVVIHPGIDTEQFKSDRQLGQTLRKEWGVRDETVLIGLVGRLDPMKGYPVFFQAASRLARGSTDCHFVIAGNGPPEYRAILCRLVEASDLTQRITWVGSHTDMPAVYNALDIACMSSLFGEGLPNAIAEAMACGVPGVVTDVGDAALLVGDTGLVVPPNDPQALADGLAKCVRMLHNGELHDPRRRIQENFGVAKLANQTEAALLALTQN